MRIYYQNFLIRSWEPGDRTNAAEIIRSALSEYSLAWEPNGADRDVLQVEQFYIDTGGEFWVIEQENKLVGTGAYYRFKKSRKIWSS